MAGIYESETDRENKDKRECPREPGATPRCGDGLTIFLPLLLRKRVPNEFEVHVDRFVIVTALLFAREKRFILIRVTRARALFQAFGTRAS